jgi:excisionase family DNA binding protein
VSEESQFLRPIEIARLLGVTPSRTYQLIATGVIPATRIGGALRIPRAAWNAWLDRRTEEALASVQEGQTAAEG